MGIQSLYDEALFQQRISEQRANALRREWQSLHLFGGFEHSWEPSDALLGKYLGADCGGGADWSVSAWPVAGDLSTDCGWWILDNEDGTYSLTRRAWDAGADDWAFYTLIEGDPAWAVLSKALGLRRIIAAECV